MCRFCLCDAAPILQGQSPRRLHGRIIAVSAKATPKHFCLCNIYDHDRFVPFILLGGMSEQTELKSAVSFFSVAAWYSLLVPFAASVWWFFYVAAHEVSNVSGKILFLVVLSSFAL